MRLTDLPCRTTESYERVRSLVFDRDIYLLLALEGRMYYFLKMYVGVTFSLWLTSQILPTLAITPGWQTMLMAGGVLTLLVIFVTPIVKILLLPINFMTLGMLSWLVHVAIIYLLTIIMPEVKIQPWTIPAATWGGFVTPSLHLSYPLALIFSSLFITFMSSLYQKINES